MAASRTDLSGCQETVRLITERGGTALHVMGITPKKMLCGIEHRLRTPDGPLRTRSLMLAELSPDESRRLQEQGLGSFRHLGCGLLLPHKGIQELHPVLE